MSIELMNGYPDCRGSKRNRGLLLPGSLENQRIKQAERVFAFNGSDNRAGNRDSADMNYLRPENPIDEPGHRVARGLFGPDQVKLAAFYNPAIHLAIAENKIYRSGLRWRGGNRRPQGVQLGFDGFRFGFCSQPHWGKEKGYRLWRGEVGLPHAREAIPNCGIG
jgi:hypothetical protein